MLIDSTLSTEKVKKIGADITYFNRLTLSVFRLISAWVNPLGVKGQAFKFSA